MKAVEFIHAKDNVMEALSVERDAMDRIVENARVKMMAKHPDGTKARQLDFMLQECKNENEMIAATIVWVSMTSQMQNRKNYTEHLDRLEKDKFKNSLKIVK